MIEIRRASPFLGFWLVVLLAGCSMLPGALPTQPSTERIGPPEVVAPPVLAPGPIGPADLEAQLGVWQAQGIDDYTWEVAFGCECMFNGPTTIMVVDGEAVKAVSNGEPVNLADIEGFPLTLDAVFAEAATTMQGGGKVTAEWARNGLPKQLNLDRDVRAIDDELGISVISVTPAG